MIFRLLTQFKIGIFNLDNAPRTMTHLGLKFLSALAAQKTKGCFLEVGPLFGSSTNAIATGRKGNDAIHTIDTFENAPWVMRRFGFDLSRELFDKFTSDIKNLTVHQGYSPDIVKNTWADDIGFFFDDATHGDPGWTENYNFFSQFFTDDAIICGDDFASGWPDIVRNVHRISQETGRELYIMGRVWAMAQAGEDRISKAVDKVCPHLKGVEITVQKGLQPHTLSAACWSYGLHTTIPIESFEINSTKKFTGEFIAFREGESSITTKHGEGSVSLAGIEKLMFNFPKAISVQFCLIDDRGHTKNTKAYKSFQVLEIPKGSKIVALRLTQ